MRGLFGFLIILLSMAITGCCHAHPYEEYREYIASDTAPNEASFTIQFLGNTNLLISDGETRILTDGYFTRAGTARSIFKAKSNTPQIHEALKRAGIEVKTTLDGAPTRLSAPSLDFVIPLHDHFDHVMDSPFVADLTGADIIGTKSTLNVVIGVKPEISLNPRKCDPATTLRNTDLSSGFVDLDQDADFQICRLGDFNVAFIKSSHFDYPFKPGKENTDAVSQPSRINKWKEGEVWILQITHNKLAGNILLIGSAGALDDDFPFNRLVRGIDMLIIAVPGYNKNGEDIFARFTAFNPPRYLVPVHWDDLFNYKDGVTLALKQQSALTKWVGETKAGFELMLNQAKSSERTELLLLPVAKTLPVHRAE